jgi:phosphoribosyl-ATP pyrophosphohydrolase/phosphoribosyl-AMP cyclohydrolase
MKSYHIDCDKDTLLIFAQPEGPTCHTGSRSCFGTDFNQNFLLQLERIVDQRFLFPSDESYVNRLRSRGVNKIAQKVGEEGVEVVIAALAQSEREFIDETSDLFFHLLVLLREKGVTLEQVAKNLEGRHQ